MHDICRLCLSVSTQIMYKFSEECQVLRKIWSCLSLQITLDECLPSSVCPNCLNKIEEISNFHDKVTENQCTLNRHLNNGNHDLENFYLSLKSDLNVKEEVKEISLIENENVNNIIEMVDENKSLVKEETITEQETTYSSEDEISLSTIKAKKNRHTSKVTNKLKAIKKRKAKAYSAPAKENIDLAKNINKYENEEEKDLKIKCLTCFNLFQSKKELLTHYNKEHGNNKVIEDTNVSKYNVVSKEGSDTYKCVKCDKVYDTKRGIRRHMIAHTDTRPFICKICGRTYKTVSQIILHGRAHGGVRLECVYQCGFSTAYKAALKDHERKHRRDEFKYKCDKCGKGFQVKTWFDEHQNIHTGAKPFICDLCGHAFHMNRYLSAHRFTVHPQSSGLKRYVCVHCSLPCDSRKTLTKHLKEHGIQTSFLCDFCGKTLSSNCQLKTHKRVHLGEKPYRCSTCDKSFTKKVYLKVHERTHTGERAHVCTQCGKRYTQRSTLVRHMRQHAGSSQQCSKCQKTFTSSQLGPHERVCDVNES